MDNCPACERPFRSLTDFPLVYIVNFVKHSLPPNLSFPYQDTQLFADPESRLSNDRPPQEVTNFFRENVEAKTFEHSGWVWHKPRDTKTDVYHRTQDQRGIILEQLNPYFGTIDAVVRSEVLTARVFPTFERNQDYQNTFRIPDSGYMLRVSDDGAHADAIRTAHLFVVKEDDLAAYHGENDTLEELASVATLEYVGRLNFKIPQTPVKPRS